MNQIPEESLPLEESSHINENRRRRKRRLFIPSGKTERSLYVNEIARRLVPGLEFYLFSALCGLILGAAILLDHPAVYILSALIAPFMAPLIGLGFSTAVGSFQFFLQSMGSLAIGSAIVFIGGLLSGWISKLIPGFSASQVHFHATFSISHLILLLVGTILAIYLTVHVPKQRSLLASAALAYEVYLPVGVAGFGLASGLKELFASAIRLGAISVLLIIMIGAIVLVFMRLRPFTPFGYLMSVVLIAAAVYMLISTSPIKASLTRDDHTQTITQMAQETGEPALVITETPKPPTSTIPIPMDATPTNTLVPTRTPTVTNTPKQTEVWATINSDIGVHIRYGPCSDDEKCPIYGAAIANKTPVLVLSRNEEGNWYQVKIPDDGREGWVFGIYLSFDAQ